MAFNFAPPTPRGHTGRTHSDETRAKIAEAHKGKTLTPEHRAKIGAAGRGSTHSAETRAKMSVALTGQKRSDETRAKMSADRKGKPAPWVSERLRGKPQPMSEAHLAIVRANNAARALPDDVRIANRKQSGRGCALKTRYGITIAQYDALAEAQGGGCALCGKACTTGKRLAVDHDHATGRVRGLLCRKCNRGLGHFDDDPAALRRAADYLTAQTDEKD